MHHFIDRTQKTFAKHNFDLNLDQILKEFEKYGWVKSDDFLLRMEFQSEAYYGNAELNIFKLEHSLNTRQ